MVVGYQMIDDVTGMKCCCICHMIFYGIIFTLQDLNNKVNF